MRRGKNVIIFPPLPFVFGVPLPPPSSPLLRATRGAGRVARAIGGGVLGRNGEQAEEGGGCDAAGAVILIVYDGLLCLRLRRGKDC